MLSTAVELRWSSDLSKTVLVWAGWRYLLLVGSIRDSSIFAAGQRSEIDNTKCIGRCSCLVSVLG